MASDSPLAGFKLAGLAPPPARRCSQRAGVSRPGRRPRRRAWRTPRHTHGPGRPRRRPIAFNPDDVPARLELLASAAGPSARSSTARRRGPTARCCASTSSSPSTARSRSRPACSFPAWTFNGQVPGPTHPRDRRRPRPRHVRQPGLAPAHDSLPRLASARDGRLAAGAPGHAGRARSSTSSTPSPSACTSTTATPCR